MAEDKGDDAFRCCCKCGLYQSRECFASASTGYVTIEGDTKRLTGTGYFDLLAPQSGREQGDIRVQVYNCPSLSNMDIGGPVAIGVQFGGSVTVTQRDGVLKLNYESIANSVTKGFPDGTRVIRSGDQVTISQVTRDGLRTVAIKEVRGASGQGAYTQEVALVLPPNDSGGGLCRSARGSNLKPSSSKPIFTQTDLGILKGACSFGDYKPRAELLSLYGAVGHGEGHGGQEEMHLSAVAAEILREAQSFFPQPSAAARRKPAAVGAAALVELESEAEAEDKHTDKVEDEAEDAAEDEAEDEDQGGGGVGGCWDFNPMADDPGGQSCLDIVSRGVCDHAWALGLCNLSCGRCSPVADLQEATRGGGAASRRGGARGGVRGVARGRGGGGPRLRAGNATGGMQGSSLAVSSDWRSLPLLCNRAKLADLEMRQKTLSLEPDCCPIQSGQCDKWCEGQLANGTRFVFTCLSMTRTLTRLLRGSKLDRAICEVNLRCSGQCSCDYRVFGSRGRKLQINKDDDSEFHKSDGEKGHRWQSNALFSEEDNLKSLNDLLSSEASPQGSEGVQGVGGGPTETRPASLEQGNVEPEPPTAAAGASAASGVVPPLAARREGAAASAAFAAAAPRVEAARRNAASGKDEDRRGRREEGRREKGRREGGPRYRREQELADEEAEEEEDESEEEKGERQRRWRRREGEERRQDQRRREEELVEDAAEVRELAAAAAAAITAAAGSLRGRGRGRLVEEEPNMAYAAEAVAE